MQRIGGKNQSCQYIFYSIPTFLSQTQIKGYGNNICIAAILHPAAVVCPVQQGLTLSAAAVQVARRTMFEYARHCFLQELFPENCKTFFPKIANFIFLLQGIGTEFAFPSAFKIDPPLPLIFPDNRSGASPSEDLLLRLAPIYCLFIIHASPFLTVLLTSWIGKDH